MEENLEGIMWSDNWWIECDKAWFVDGRQNILCRIDLNTNECEIVAGIPDSTIKNFRLNSRCIKCGKDVFCMPQYGNSIWVYDTNNKIFSGITISNPDMVCLLMYDFWKHGDKIFAISVGLKKIIEIDIQSKKIESQYTICEKGNIAKSIMIENEIYILELENNDIYRFCLNSKTFQVYSIPNIQERMYTLCFDDDKFWMSGYKKKIYVWTKDNVVRVIDNFPLDFGIYDFSVDTVGRADCIIDEYKTPTFLYSVMVGDYIWYIPFLTNQIIYVDKKTYNLYTFDVKEECETKASILKNEMRQKYLLEYVKDNRYIGVFSFMNSSILEIDALNLVYQYKQYYVQEDHINRYAQICHNTFNEKITWQRQVYQKKLCIDNNIKQGECKCSIGQAIYNLFMKTRD